MKRNKPRPASQRNLDVIQEDEEAVYAEQSERSAEKLLVPTVEFK